MTQQWLESVVYMSAIKSCADNYKITINIHWTQPNTALKNREKKSMRKNEVIKFFSKTIYKKFHMVWSAREQYVFKIQKRQIFCIANMFRLLLNSYKGYVRNSVFCNIYKVSWSSLSWRTVASRRRVPLSTIQIQNVDEFCKVLIKRQRVRTHILKDFSTKKFLRETFKEKVYVN